MRKKRVLFLSEASYLSTGYATYSREILSRLQKSGNYEVAELSIYGGIDDPRRNSIPWKNYPNLPFTEEEKKFYHSSTINQFGSWRFERACLDFRPDVILDVRDHWMSSYVKNSVYRRIYKWIWMPTIDARPQNPEWISTFADSDYILTYSNWAKDWLEKNTSIKVAGVASPAASKEFIPSWDKASCKSQLGINPEHKIAGTVMRNQRRKLFPALFEAFGKFIKEKNNQDVYLYCHTSYPDHGWDLPAYLLSNDISSRVYFTYMCKCGHFEARKFNDVVQQCPKCRQFTLSMSHVNSGLELENLAKVYQSFDLYVQAANSEGFGIPVVEAGACGIPICATNYSAMEDFPKTLNAYPIKVKEFYNELETGCDRAIIDTDHLASIFQDFFSLPYELRCIKGKETRSLFEENYDWDSCAKLWASLIDKCEYADWSVPPMLLNQVDALPKVKSNKDLIAWTFGVSSINDNQIYSHDYLGLLRDISYGALKRGTCGYFFPESSIFDSESYHPISQQTLLDAAKSRIDTNNFWEKARVGLIELKEESWLK